MQYPTLRRASLEHLVQRLQAERLVRHDLIVPASNLSMDGLEPVVTIADVPVDDDLGELLSSMPGIRLSDGSVEAVAYDVLDPAHAQLGDTLGIPRRYYRRMMDEHQPLLASNVNRWLRHPDEARSFLVRTFRPEPGKGDRGVIRAVLSNRYAIMDNLDLLATMLETVKRMGVNVRIETGDLSAQRMHLRLTCPDVTLPVPELMRRYRNPGTGGQDVRLTAGLLITNSETGHGAFNCTPRPIANCYFNALLWKPHALRRVHLGERLDDGVVEWSAETHKKQRELVEAQTADAIRTFLSTDYLEKLTAEMMGAAKKEVKHPQTTVVKACQQVGIPEEERDEVFRYFIQGGDTSHLGVVQAMTYHAQQQDDPELQYTIEMAIADLVSSLPKLDAE